MKNIVVGNEEKETEGVQRWCEEMTQPLSAKAKYSRAVESITGAPCTLYHAIKYRDVPVVDANVTSERLKSLKLADKIRSPDFSEENKAVLWKYIDEITRLAFSAADVTPPEVPSRTAIDANIRERRGAKAAASGGGGGKGAAPSSSSSTSSRASWDDGFREAVASLLECRGCGVGGGVGETPSVGGGTGSEPRPVRRTTRLGRAPKDAPPSSPRSEDFHEYDWGEAPFRTTTWNG